ncbi:hypothetical protein CAEBREN_32296 [Caenorhabditis brenneri]|uniref:Reverse transcriptase/retrotransposon-derived protein RNase H-like domain-containing protein n=1 Tax=Caenorhabditis brenneri TaxID=135651 RepID=G0P7H9_CAEBE|nr:hypothetical protein CAEBREN_32296 [Caenorhabditis brenneri]
METVRNEQQHLPQDPLKTPDQSGNDAQSAQKSTISKPKTEEKSSEQTSDNKSEESSRTPKFEFKIEVGNTTALKEWLIDYNKAMLNLKITHDAGVEIMTPFLTRLGKEKFRDLLTEQTKLGQKVVEKVVQTFEMRTDKDIAWKELSMLKQDNLSVADFAERLRVLGELAFENEVPQEVREAILINSFIQNCTEQLQKNLMTTQSIPKTLDDIVIRMERFLILEEYRAAPNNKSRREAYYRLHEYDEKTQETRNPRELAERSNNTKWRKDHKKSPQSNCAITPQNAQRTTAVLHNHASNEASKKKVSWFHRTNTNTRQHQGFIPPNQFGANYPHQYRFQRNPASTPFFGNYRMGNQFQQFPPRKPFNKNFQNKKGSNKPPSVGEHQPNLTPNNVQRNHNWRWFTNKNNRRNMMIMFSIMMTLISPTVAASPKYMQLPDLINKNATSTESSYETHQKNIIAQSLFKPNRDERIQIQAPNPLASKTVFGKGTPVGIISDIGEIQQSWENTSSPASQRGMNDFTKNTNARLFVHIDGTKRMFSTSTKRLRNIHFLLKKIEEIGTKLKVGKSQHTVSQLRLLGFIVPDTGILPDSKKTKAVDDSPERRTVEGVRTFIQLTSFQCQIIENFFKIAAPILKLTKNDKEFVWTDKCNEAFKQLKPANTKNQKCVAPMLGKPVTLEVNSSGKGVDAILLHTQDFEGNDRRVGTVVSSVLTGTEKKSPGMELRVLGLSYAVHQLWPYIDGPFLPWKNLVEKLATNQFKLQYHEKITNHSPRKQNEVCGAVSTHQLSENTILQKITPEKQRISSLFTVPLIDFNRTNQELKSNKTIQKTSNQPRKLKNHSETLFGEGSESQSQMRLSQDLDRNRPILRKSPEMAEPFHKFHAHNLVSSPKTAQENIYVAVLVGTLLKFIMATTEKDQKVDNRVRIFENRTVARFGAPKSFPTDKGTNHLEAHRNWKVTEGNCSVLSGRIEKMTFGKGKLPFATQ